MINNGKAALVAAALITMMSCTQKNETQADNGYIGPSDIKIEDGRMTPEALLSLGRLSRWTGRSRRYLASSSVTLKRIVTGFCPGLGKYIP